MTCDSIVDPHVTDFYMTRTGGSFRVRLPPLFHVFVYFMFSPTIHDTVYLTKTVLSDLRCCLEF